MKLAVIGSRNFNDYNLLSAELNGIQNITEIISGGANGADALAKRFAMANNIKLTEFPANYKMYGKKAPHVRNDLIVATCDQLVAFWDNYSPGTKSMIQKAKKAKKLHGVIELGHSVG